MNILLTELSRSVWDNLDLGRVYRPHCVRSVLTTSVKILPYRPPARLIRAKYSKLNLEGLLTKACNIGIFIQVWREAPADLQRSLFSHFLELLGPGR